MTLCRFLAALSLTLTLLAISAVGLAATTGQITGTVTDSSGAAVPTAQVAATQPDTGLSKVTVTDVNGKYSLLALQTGRYNLKFTRDGFKTYEKVGVVVDVNSALLIDATLEVGSVVSNVMVQANSVSVETVNTQLGDVIAGTAIESLPLNGRSYTDLLGLQPGVVPESASTIDPGASYGGTAEEGNLSINGQREDSNGFLVNGGTVEEARNNGAAVIPNLDSIAEFRVLTNSMDADNGHYAGGLVSVITKTGTNQFHGNIFEFLRNTDLDAKNYFDAPSTPREIFQQNQFGATIGGPIFRNKLFFFGDYQGTRTTQGLSSGEVPVPSAAERTGDFSGLASQLTGAVNGPYFASYLGQLLGYPVTSGEPYYTTGCTTGAQCVFPNAQIPSAVFASAAKGLLQYIPNANTPGGFFVSSANNQTTDDNRGGVRVDYDSNKLGHFSVYYYIDRSRQVTPFGTDNLPGFPILNVLKPWSINIGYTKTFNTTTINEFRFALTRFVGNNSQPQSGLGVPLSAFGFQEGGAGGIVPANPAYSGVPSVSFNSFSFGQPGVVYQRFETPPNYTDNFSKVIKNHFVKVGAQYESSSFHEYFPSVGGNGFIGFNGSETGVDFADYLLGAPASFIQESTLDYHNIKHYFGVYGEDSWQVGHGLTVNYGLRWEYIPNWYEKENESSDTFVAGEQSRVYPTAPEGLVFAGDPRPGGGTIPRTVANTPLNNFAPRIGFAYTPDRGKTSFRAAYGIFYTNNEGSQIYSITGAPPFAEFYDSPAPPFLDTPYINRTDGMIHPSPFPFTPAKPGDTTYNFAPFLPLSAFPTWSLYNRTPYAENYQFTFQREITPSMVASIGYVGSQDHALMDAYEVNPGNAALCLSLSQPSEVAPGTPTCGPFGENTVYTTASGQTINSTRAPLGPNFGSDVAFATIGNSNYSSLQSSLKFRAKNVNFLAAYTWSKSLDDSSGARNQVLDPYNHKLSRELSAWDTPQNFVINYNYVLPFAQPSRLSFRSLLSGWTFTGITRFVTGLPVTMSETDDNSLIGETTQPLLDRPQYDGAYLQFRNPRSRQTWFDTSHFAPEALGTIGNARTRFFHGPGINNTDLALHKDTVLRESLNLEFRAEFFNVGNHAQFQTPSGDVNSAAFGQVLNANSPRIGQVALKLNF
jgi:Carboxypeptidase regulatory-like domain